MKLSKTFSGQYELNTNVDGLEVRVEATTQSYGGFSYSCYVNDMLMGCDGYTGLKLGNIKKNLESIVNDSIEQYRS